MAKLSLVFLPMFGSATVFPDVLVPVLGQPKLPSDLIGTTMHVPSERELENHLGSLGANPTFTKHMEVFRGSEAMNSLAAQLQGETGLAMSIQELFQCAQEASCLQVWTTADALTGKTVRITQILGSWSMSETGVGNVCHVNAKRDVAYCHVPSDGYKSGLSWLAMGVPVDMPLQKPLPVGIRCHDMGPNSHDAPCHLLSGNEFMAARIENMDIRWQSHSQLGEGQVPAIVANTRVVSLGWGPAKHTGAFVSGGFCLDLGGGASVDGAPVQMWQCLGNTNQRWAWVDYGYHSFAIFFDGDQQAQRHCLDVPGQHFVAGQEVWIWECNGMPGQDWSWSGQQLRLKAVPSLCLERSDIEGGYPLLADCSDSQTQVWSLDERTEMSV